MIPFVFNAFSSLELTILYDSLILQKRRWFFSQSFFNLWRTKNISLILANNFFIVVCWLLWIKINFCLVMRISKGQL
jgi:hypothetical protein